MCIGRTHFHADLDCRGSTDILYQMPQQEPSQRPKACVKEEKVSLSITSNHGKQSTLDMVKEMIGALHEKNGEEYFIAQVLVNGRNQWCICSADED